MKELQIIIKQPDDGNPLNLPNPKKGYDKYMTIGWKFEHTDGKMYGDYICLQIEGTDEEAILKHLDILVRQAYETERML